VPDLRIVNLEGTRRYISLLRAQHRLIAARREGTLSSDVALVLEHAPVFTLGRNATREHLKVSETFLTERGIQVVQAERGGDITYHGPGQVVAYLIFDLRAARMRIPDYISRLEEAMIRVARDFDVPAGRNPLNPGVWVGNRKLGSIGIAVRHGIAYHGLALNANLSLEPFTWIHPCGLTGISMTSLKEERGRDIKIEDVKSALSGHLKDLFEGRGIAVNPMSSLGEIAIRP